MVVAVISCVDGDSNGGDAGYYDEVNPYVQATRSYDATATFGAEQFSIQLTAIAEKDQ